MEIKTTILQGVYEIFNHKLKDKRGCFVKTFHFDTFQNAGLETHFKESYYSVSTKNVIRGMHFQLPPHDHAKLVYVIDGEILDVALDLRRDSKTYGLVFSTTLTSENSKSVYLDKGFAHGFLTLSETATVVYMTTTVYEPEFDTGIRWDSFGFDWKIEDPIISDRDLAFRSLRKYRTPTY